MCFLPFLNRRERTVLIVYRILFVFLWTSTSLLYPVKLGMSLSYLSCLELHVLSVLDFIPPCPISVVIFLSKIERGVPSISPF